MSDLVEFEPLGKITLTLRINRESVGFVSLVHYEELNQGVIVGLYVDPRYRGKGYAKQLIQRIVEIGKKEGLVEVAAMVNPDNAISNKLFESMGFYPWNMWVLRDYSKLNMG